MASYRTLPTHRFGESPPSAHRSISCGGLGLGVVVSFRTCTASKSPPSNPIAPPERVVLEGDVVHQPSGLLVVEGAYEQVPVIPVVFAPLVHDPLRHRRGEYVKVGIVVEELLFWIALSDQPFHQRHHRSLPSGFKIEDRTLGVTLFFESLLDNGPIPNNLFNAGVFCGKITFLV